MFDILFSPIWLTLLILLIWIGAGALILYLQSRPAGSSEYRRRVTQHVYNCGESVKIYLELKPPVLQSQPEDHDILLVLDHSGSMGASPGSPLREAIRSMQNFVRQLPDNYHIGLIIFDHEAQVLCQITNKHTEILRALKTIGSGGMTAIHDALDKSLDVLENGRIDVNKTIILLSDGGSNPSLAEKSANKLKTLNSNLSIICIGFGPYVDKILLKNLADKDEDYLHVNKSEDLEPLFNTLVQKISGKKAVAGLIEERVYAPYPFRVDKTGDLSPVSINMIEGNTKISWSMTVLKESIEPVYLNYSLIPECAGWYSIAPSDAQALWKMPGGGKNISMGKIGPNILVLPNGFTWTWPILNPLFWILFGKLIKCSPKKLQIQENERITIKPEPSLPEPIAIPEIKAYASEIKPALIIGLGELGEWTLTRLKWLLRDRCIDKEKFNLLVVQDSSIYNRPIVEFNGCSLQQEERIILQHDLRPYLENLRQQGVPASRNWLPLHQWLGKSIPLTTYADDRRKARLALLLEPDKVATHIQPIVEQIREDEGIVILVAAGNDAEGTGMLAEIAHMCARFSHDVKGVTAVLAPEDSKPSQATVGMVNELARMLSMRGEAIYSDRGEELTYAKQLFDRVLVTDPIHNGQMETSKKIAQLLWSLLAYPEVLSKLPGTIGETCYKVNFSGQNLPQRSLWEWVREKTLSDVINKKWLDISVKNNHVIPSEIPPEVIENYMAAFWGYGDLDQPLPGQLLQKSAMVLQKTTLSVIMEDLSSLPLDNPYHEQQIYCDGERHVFAKYVQVWCYFMLNAEAKYERWGLPVLLETVSRIEQDFEHLMDGANRLSGNTALAPHVALVTSIYKDYLFILNRLRAALERWVQFFTGWQPGMNLTPLVNDCTPVCVDIEMQHKIVEKHLVFNKKDAILQPLYKTWLDSYGQGLLQQLRFQIEPDPGAQNFNIQLCIFDEKMDINDAAQKRAIITKIRKKLNYYQHVVFQWPSADWVNVVNSTPTDAQRFGYFSNSAYPEVNKSIDSEDPFFAASIVTKQIELSQAFLLEPNILGIYAWPEEANASRIANKLENILDFEASFHQNPKIVSLIRDPEKLFALLIDMAEGHLSKQGHKVVLYRNEKHYEVGPTDQNFVGIELFHDIVRQVGLLGISWPDAKYLPAPALEWKLTPEETLKLVEKNPLAIDSSSDPIWALWQEVIKGLVLEYQE
ncbi:vWA domain-containing protein [Candidatus Venteria ishoeyi]|nr:vWA domain-containing protein [Candidatus Venteria ishoeyi]